MPFTDIDQFTSVYNSTKMFIVGYNWETFIFKYVISYSFIRELFPSMFRLLSFIIPHMDRKQSFLQSLEHIIKEVRDYTCQELEERENFVSYDLGFPGSADSPTASQDIIDSQTSRPKRIPRLPSKFKDYDLN